MRFQARSDVGLVRTNNEDAYLIAEDKRLFVVCDGLGGHAAGEVASNLAIETLNSEIPINSFPDPRLQVTSAINKANRKILDDQQEHPERLGMGTTVSLLWLPSGTERTAWIGHIGDSRIYRLRDNEFEQLTEDHSPIYRLYKEGTLSKDDLRHHPQKNLIERSLGLSQSPQCDVFATETEPGDLYLLCTDGLSDCLSDETIGEVCRFVSWDELSENLVQKALDHGGFDNVTVLITQCIG